MKLVKNLLLYIASIGLKRREIEWVWVSLHVERVLSVISPWFVSKITDGNKLEIKCYVFCICSCAIYLDIHWIVAIIDLALLPIHLIRVIERSIDTSTISRVETIRKIKEVGRRLLEVEIELDCLWFEAWGSLSKEVNREVVFEHPGWFARVGIHRNRESEGIGET